MQANKLKNRALHMRSRGSSFEEILNEVPVSKSTLGRWLRGMLLTTDQYVRIGGHKDRRGLSRSKAADTLRLGRVTRETKYIKEADELFEKFEKDPLFLMGLVLYWNQGSKSGLSFQFTTSDDQLLFFMTKWVSWYLGYPATRHGYRLYTYSHQKDMHHERIWAGRLGVPVEAIRVTYLVRKKTPKQIKDGYKGSVRIEIGEVRAYQLTMRWLKRLIPLILSATGPHSLMDKVTDFGSVDLGSTPGGGTK